MKKTNQNTKMAKVLAATLFGVGFVTPLMFSNITEAANFGTGGTVQWLANNVLTHSDVASQKQWAIYNTGTAADNYVYFHDKKFKIVAVDTTDGTGIKSKVTLWAYDDSFGESPYNSTRKAWDTDANKAYAISDLKKALDALYETSSGAKDGLLYDERIIPVSLASEANVFSDPGVEYQEETSTDIISSYIWAPSSTEVKGDAVEPAGTWGFTTENQRELPGTTLSSYTRSPLTRNTGMSKRMAVQIDEGGTVGVVFMECNMLRDLRPALTIWNRTSAVFTTNVAIPTDGVFTADGDTQVNYAAYMLNSDAVKPIFTPATDGVILDGTKITAIASTTAGYVTTGLLTTNDGATWDAINTGATANIAYMAQVNSGDNTLNLSGVPAGTNYNLKIFGLKTSDTTVTQLADNAVQGLSKGTDGKIHMKIGGTYNNGVPVTLKDGAVVDLAGTANNDIIVSDNGIIAGTGVLNGTIGGTGSLTVDGSILTNADNIGSTLASVTVNASKTLTLTGGTLSKDVTNNGTVKTNGNVTISGALNGGAGGKLVVESGKLIYTNTTAGSITNNVEIKAGATLDPDAGVFANGTTVTNYGTLEITGGTLNATIDGKGGDNLVMKGQMGIGAGSVKQVAGSNITVAASLIEAGTNDPSKAMFTGVNDASKLNVSAGNLTLTGLVYEDMYYVLMAGTAVGGAVTEAALWKADNVKFPGVLFAEYETDISGNSAAFKVTRVVTFEEGNTPGLAAVRQGAITVGKELTDEVEKHLGLIDRPEVREKDKAKLRNVASTAKDDYKVDVVEQGNANEIMPVQVVEKDKYDKEVWASYIRTKETTEGMNLGAGLKGDNTAQYNGTVVGVDFYSSKKAIAGMALSYTTGDIDSYSGTTSTRNKSKYYGISFYDRVTNGNTALIYDIGYIRGDNDISQFYTGKETTSDVKTNTYTAGARWEAAIETGRSKIVPFAAFRYMRVNNGDYTNSHGTKFETKNQNLYIPKVGIAWTGDFIMPKSVWIWRPSVEAGYVWNLGDRTADSNVLMGTNVAPLEYDTVDKSSYYAKAGMEFTCKNFTAGVFYRYLKGSAVRNNKWNVNVSWSF